MRKTLYALTILMPFLIIVPTYSSSTAANYVEPLTYSGCGSKLLANSIEIKNYIFNEDAALQKYYKATEDAKTVNVADGFNYYMRMLLQKKKELYPEQMNSDLTAAKSNRIKYENKIKYKLRNIYISLYLADKNLKAEKQNYAIAEKVYDRNKIIYSNGSMADLDAIQSDLNYMKAKKALDASQRSYDNVRRELNAFIGVPIGTSYGTILPDNYLNVYKVNNSQYYIDKALAQRSEITGLQTQIDLTEQEMKIMETNQVYQMYIEARKEYESLQSDLNSLKVNLEKTRCEIEKEIKNAYLDITKDSRKVEALRRSLEISNTNLFKIQSKYQTGMISQAEYEQYCSEADDSGTAYDTAVFKLNTKLMELENASGLGPAY